MKQLKVGNILMLAKELNDNGMSLEEIRELPIYIGNDDELNGIHCAWYGQLVDKDKEDDKDLVDLINEDHHNLPLKGKAILIS
jgi:hypothetical protein